MSAEHPIVAITGSSSVVSDALITALEHVFWTERVKAAYIEGTAFFRYERAVANQYQLQVMRMDTLGHDDVPEGVFPRIFKRFSLANTLTLFISPVDNDSVVIGNLVSPILVCQQTDK